jgi:hypothetical protein
MSLCGEKSCSHLRESDVPSADEFTPVFPVETPAFKIEKPAGRLYKAGMTTVKEIENAVEHLPPNDLNQFRNWFQAFEAASWDRQFEADARNGRLESLVNEARAEYDRLIG